MAVSNPEHRALGLAARKAFNKVKRQPNVEYVMTVRGTKIICWANTGAPGAMLNIMGVAPSTDAGLHVTYLQVRKDGVTLRSMVRHANVSELERWFRHFPEDRALLETPKVG